VKTLILQAFEIYSKKNLSNQALRKYVKLHNLVSVNSKELLYLQRAPFLVFFLYFYIKLV